MLPGTPINATIFAFLCLAHPAALMIFNEDPLVENTHRISNGEIRASNCLENIFSKL